MQFPERFSDLPEYAFPRLRRLLGDLKPGGPEIAMSIGEPRRQLPQVVGSAISENIDGFGRYPPNEGIAELRDAISAWIARRFSADVDPERGVLPLNGTREGLFNAALALCREGKRGHPPAVLIPNPFYQCYAAAALAVGAEPVFLPATRESGFLPDFGALDRGLLDRTELVYLCSPSNPQGAVASAAYWRELLTLAERHDFRVLADECYSEIYRTNAPFGALEVCRTAGSDPERLIAFNSLSKRSSVPGLRSGFAVGGPRSIAAMRQLRSYGGAPLPLPLQYASAALWRDEDHVTTSREDYRKKRALADTILGELPHYVAPVAGFFVWLEVGDGETVARRLYSQAGIRVLPGAYLARGVDGQANPGAKYVRIALVPGIDEVSRGLAIIREMLGEGTVKEDG